MTFFLRIENISCAYFLVSSDGNFAYNLMLQDDHLGKRYEIWEKLYCPTKFFSWYGYVSLSIKHESFRSDSVGHSQKAWETLI